MIVVVTGASAGVGRATALEFARQGIDVVLLARNAARLEAATEEVRGQGVRALPIVADVADANAVEAAANRIETEFGPIDIWVNNAMATIFAPIDEVWVGLPTVMTIVGNKLAPGLLDHYLARTSYSGQLTDEPVPSDAPANLFKTADGDYGAHGRFDSRARGVSYQAVASRHRGALTLGLLGLGCLGLTTLLTRRRAQVEAKL